ncbi:MAG: 1-deoxy-D-xylulose-5-phosphate reductoisomerase [Planctomycetota bacterium]|jgi:1-deoxy-D-xylulose-5-phosphate reductoisomerase
MVRRIAILGSTGSIGTNALRVIEGLGEGYSVFALSGHSKVELLAEQVRAFGPKYVAVTDASCRKQLVELVGDLDVEVLSGAESLVALAELDEVDTVLTAVVGGAGLHAVLAAARKGKRLAIANKEPLVMAGELLIKEAKRSGSEILPVDSEHSAIFQAMQAGKPSEVAKIILTASGGPFREMSAEKIEDVSLEQALAHPTWDMGPKITIDSATMMNKALEIIEARWLFDVPVEKIEVLIHPESIVHSLVEFVDASVIAQLGQPDMCLPIQYALTFPDRLPSPARAPQLARIGRLNFAAPDPRVFRAVPLAYEVSRAGGTASVVFNAANEQAVEEFLAGRVKFVNILELVEHCLSNHDSRAGVSLEELLQADAWARREVAATACGT